MSLRAPSLLTLVHILQHHGLTYDLLKAFATVCERKETGRFIVHLGEGKIVGYDVRMPRELPACDDPSLTNY